MANGKRVTVAVVAMALAASLAAAGPLAVAEGGNAPAAPNATSLLRFYPSRLASTPMGVVDDQEVWLAKVQGLLATAPPFLQQSLLMSQSKKEFAANIALLQQMQEKALAQSALRLQTQIQSGLVKK